MRRLKAIVSTPFFVAVILATYFAIAMTAYRFRHPEMTETQLFKNIPDAMIWGVD